MLDVLFLWCGAIFVVLVSIVKDKIEIDRKDGEGGRTGERENNSEGWSELQLVNMECALHQISFI